MQQRQTRISVAGPAFAKQNSANFNLHRRVSGRGLLYSASQSGGEYSGAGADHPRKYIKGPLRQAYVRRVYKTPEVEYRSTCESLGAKPNSVIRKRLHRPDILIPTSKLLCVIQDNNVESSASGEAISLRDTYVGERGFLALMPLLNQNNMWTFLDASNNGLRNECVLHLVDMLLQVQHQNRPISLNLSRNPLSDVSVKALMELVQKHPCIEMIDLSRTQVQKRHIIKLHEMIARRSQERCDEASQGSPMTARLSGSVTSSPGRSPKGQPSRPESPASPPVDSGLAPVVEDLAELPEAAAVPVPEEGAADASPSGEEKNPAAASAATAAMDETAPAPQEPGLQEPSLQEPSLHAASLQEPSVQEPSVQEPSLQETPGDT
eukprot:TRINITY_DN20960_c0_g1_i1.p1 TRINITY_DN20960_c0_g1~~TRINITY_DN20960_c0_g1_i1.p1  ORF type:complete len:379 (-),score=61.51 TRINITY_DN20960_c0_g1_i1:180-1316(-)